MSIQNKIQNFLIEGFAKEESKFIIEEAFTRQHYEKIAQIIKEVKNDNKIIALKIAKKFVDLFDKDNERFDAIKFLAACGFTHSDIEVEEGKKEKEEEK
ncbi:MAG: hypothetical protein QXG00_06645 [Candidatus Woesearchaeota archaeon]